MDCLAVFAKADIAVLIGVFSLVLSFFMSLFQLIRGRKKQ